VVGFIGLKKELIESYMILDMMQVSAACRGQGIGKKLFDSGKEEARKEQRPCIFLHVHLKKLLLFIKLWELNSQIV